MDKLINAMKMNPGGDGYDDYDDYDDDEMDVSSSRKIRQFGSRAGSQDDYDDEPQRRQYVEQRQTGAAQRTNRRMVRPAGSGMEVCVIKPTTVEEARELTETLLANRTVVLNLEGLDVGIAQRIIDFASGSCYALRGNLINISRYIFVVTPESVDISGDISSAFGAGAEETSSSFNMPFA